MNRRSFAALLPALAAGLPALAEAQTGISPTPAPPASAAPVETGVYPGFTPPGQFARPRRTQFLSRHPAHGDRLRGACVVPCCGRAARAGGEAHAFGNLAGAGGQVELHLNGVSHFLSPGDVGIAVAGTLHWVRNAGDTVASYFVMEVGTGPIGH